MYKDFELFGVNEPEKILIELRNRGRFKRKPITYTLNGLVWHICVKT